jgi:hypothetical protein
MERASEGYPCAGCGTFICLRCEMRGVAQCRACAERARTAPPPPVAPADDGRAGARPHSPGTARGSPSRTRRLRSRAWLTEQRSPQFAVVRAAVAPMHVEPRVASTQTSQLLAGHPLLVHDASGDWLRASGADGYVAWVHRGYLATPDAPTRRRWKGRPGRAAPRGTRREPW